jgi:hypothetical protein
VAIRSEAVQPFLAIFLTIQAKKKYCMKILFNFEFNNLSQIPMLKMYNWKRFQNCLLN